MNKVAVGPMNSTVTVYEQYCYSTATVLIVPCLSAKRVKLKKKKKKKERKLRRKFQSNPNGTVI